MEKTQKVYEGTYNIWYNKWTGQKHKGRFEFGERAPSRINLIRDSGYTLADKRKQQNPSFRMYFCLMFARGGCHKGHKCEYMHRIPLPDDPEETMKVGAYLNWGFTKCYHCVNSARTWSCSICKS
jgi:hypothetical protein